MLLVEGERQTLNQFYNTYSKIYSMLCSKIRSNEGLLGLGEKRKDGAAFTREDNEADLGYINEIFSSKFDSRKRKKKSDPTKERQRMRLPPLKRKEECKGIAYFKGWSHKNRSLVMERWQRG